MIMNWNVLLLCHFLYGERVIRRLTSGAACTRDDRMDENRPKTQNKLAVPGLFWFERQDEVKSRTPTHFAL
jgi:hypothetical protein